MEIQGTGTGASLAIDLPRDRPLWKTLVLGAVIAYSPVAAALLVLTLTVGTFSASGGARTIFGGLTFVSSLVAVVIYLVAAGIAVIFVDRRHEPATFSFWSAFRSVVLFYLAVLLPFIVIASLALLFGVIGNR